MDELHKKVLIECGLDDESCLENDDYYWDLIEKINWKLDQDWVLAKKRLKSLQLSLDERNDLYQFVVAKKDQLDKYVSSIFPPGTSPTCGADDSYNDYLYSAVGHGKTYYNSLFDPKHKWDKKEAEEKTVEDFWLVVETENEK